MFVAIIPEENPTLLNPTCKNNIEIRTNTSMKKKHLIQKVKILLMKYNAHLCDSMSQNSNAMWCHFGISGATTI